MKKLIALMMALVTVLSLCAFAGAEEADISALKIAAPAGAPALALAALAKETPDQYTFVAADTGLYRGPAQCRCQIVQGRQVHLQAGGRGVLGQPVLRLQARGFQA